MLRRSFAIYILIFIRLSTADRDARSFIDTFTYTASSHLAACSRADIRQGNGLHVNEKVMVVRI